MKKFVLFILLLAFTDIEAQELTVMSYNIKYDDGFSNVNSWNYRKENLIELINKNDPDILGVQEALSNQVKYIENKGSYAYYGVGRDDGKKKGEYCAVLYKADKLELIDSGTFWLSETPESPSIGWDASYKRIVSWVKFLKDGNEFYFFNVHIDHKGEQAKKYGTELLVKRINEIAGDLPVLLAGDFNYNYKSCHYQYLVDPAVKGSVKDSFFFADSLKIDTPETFRGFSIKPNEYSDRIDYIFYKGDVKIKEYRTDTSNNGLFYYSDHIPVIVNAEIK